MSGEIAGVTLLQMGDGGTPEVFTTIANVQDFDAPGIEQTPDDVTSHDGGGWEHSLPIVLRGGEISLELAFLPTNATHSYTMGLLKAAYDKTKSHFRVIYPDTGSTMWECWAYVVKVRPKAKIKGSLRAAVTLRATGAPYWYMAVGGALAAYDPYRADSYATSLINLVNPGTYNCAQSGVIAVPTQLQGTGWIYPGGVRTGLTTGITPALLDQSWSVFAWFDGATSVVRRPLLSAGSTFPARYLDLWPRGDIDERWYGSGNKAVAVAPAAASGWMGISGRKCWLNGTHVATLDVTTDTFNPGNVILLGIVGYDVDTMIGNIKRVLIDDRVYSDEEVAVVYQEMTSV